MKACIMVRREGSLLVFRICQWSQVKILDIQKADLETKWTCLRHSQVSHEILSVGNSL